MTEPEEMHDVLEQIAALAPDQADAPHPPGQMLAQIKMRLPEERSSAELRGSLSRRITQMFSRKYALGAIVALLFVFALAFPPVRTAASEFLGRFRVQKFAAISVSPRQLAMLERIGEDGLFPGEFEFISEPGGPQTLTSLTEATMLAGYRVRTPAALESPTTVRMTEGAQGRLTVNLTGARALLQTADVDPLLLPDSLEGAEVDVSVFPTFEQEWHSGVYLIQTKSPVVNYPDDVDTAALGEALLQFLGMTPSEAQRLARNIDWTNTVLLPVPKDLATFNEVRVDGVSGLGLSSLEGNGNSLMWEKDGIVYLLLADELDMNALRDIANSLN